MDEHSKKVADIYTHLGTKYIVDAELNISEEMFWYTEHLTPGARILDVGCAGGRDSQIFVDHGFEVVGIDITESFIAAAKKRIPQATLYVMDVLELDFPDDHFDFIWAHAILLHVQKKNIPQVLASFHRVLKPNGYVHILVKEGEGESEAVHIVKNAAGEIIGKDVKRPFIFFRKDELDQFIIDSGLRILHSELVEDVNKRSEIKWISVRAQK